MKCVILGATGTLGMAMLTKLLKESNYNEIFCLSRDELKQYEMRKQFNDRRLIFRLCDIRDNTSFSNYFDGSEIIFHFAALKHISMLEANPIESIKTNILGTINAAESAIKYEVPYFVYSSTDKACQPINVYGASKFISECILFNFNNNQNKTIFSVYRWGNVIGSRGSVVPKFINDIKHKKPITITDCRMTRFWIKVEDAINYILKTYKYKSNNIKTPDMKSASLVRIIDIISKKYGEYETEIIGIKNGEKLHEVLMYNNETDSSITSNSYQEYDDDELSKLIFAE